MITKHKWLLSFLFFTSFTFSQNFKGVYKIDSLLELFNNKDTTYVINFWATWCKPCVEELPVFDSLMILKKNNPVKVILVSLDFKEELEKKVMPFLKKKNRKTECVLLDEVNGNVFIDKISPQWTGAIPATLIKKGDKKVFLEKKIKLDELLENVGAFVK
jgi:thiol-disulfide isomerase/thioredoxin